MADPDALDVAKAIGNCATLLGLEIEADHEHGPKAHLRAAKPCNRRLCPFCEWRRARAWRRRFFEGLPAFHADYPTHRAIFLTLTVKNCSINNLRSEINELHKSWARLRKLSFFPTDLFFRKTEITARHTERSDSVGMDFHPHLHALLLVPASYFSHGYVRHSEWQKQWMMSARLDYQPVVGVQKARASGSKPPNDPVTVRAAVMEASKYATKATDLISMGNSLGEYNRQVKGLRMYSVSDALRKYIKSGDISEKEMLDQGTPTTGETFMAQASWFEDVGEYLFTDIS